MEVVAFIFARGGSKGIPNKNIQILGGKPLIAWAIESAFEVPRIKRVIVSTDSEKIAAISREYGADVPFIRPSELATDQSPEWLAWQHGLNYLQETDGILPHAMVSVPATAPLRLAIDIENCIDEFEKGLSDIVITVTDAHRSPYFNMVEVETDGSVNLVNKLDKVIVRRQDSPTVYDMTTVAYVVNPEFVMSKGAIFEGRVAMVHVPLERAIDIDSPLDFQIAEFLLSLRKQPQ